MNHQQRFPPKLEASSVTSQFLNQPEDWEVDRSRMFSQRIPSITHIYQIEASSFPQAKSPILTQEKKESIQAKLELEKNAYLNTQERIKNDRLFVKYSSNPFMESSGNKQGDSQYRQQDWSEDITGSKNLVEAVNDIDVRPIRQFQKDDFQSRKKDLQKFSAANKRIGSLITKNPQILQQNSQKDPSNQLSFQQIISMPQTKFQPKKAINIFKVLNPNFQPQNTSQTLHKHHFHWNSATNYNSKYRIPIQNHLSTASRKAMLREISFELTSEESNIDFNTINLQSMLGVAAGRLTPKAINQASQGIGIGIQQLSQKSSQGEQRDFSYNQNTFHQGTNYYDDDFDRQQIKEYLRYTEYSKDELRAIRRYDGISRDIKEQLLTRNEVVKTRINDKKLHAQMQGKINENISLLMNYDRQTQKNIDKIISRNKDHKDRKINLKNKAMIDSLQHKRANDIIINEMIRGKAKKGTK